VRGKHTPIELALQVLLLLAKGGETMSNANSKVIRRENETFRPATVAQWKLAALVVIPQRAKSFVHAVVAAMSPSKQKPPVMFQLLTVILAAMGLVAFQAQGQSDSDSKPIWAGPAKGADEGSVAQETPPPTDRFGDTLPPAAVARMGSLRLYHGDDVDDVVLSPDGNLVVSVSRGGSRNRLWEAVTGKELPLSQDVRDAAPFAAAGKLLAVQEQMDGLRLSDLCTGKEIAWFALPSPAYLFALAPDGKTLVAWSHERSMRFCDVSTKKVSGPFQLGVTGHPL
jgi:hypothetical protein